MKVDVLLGLQWGDEGKGKVVDVLAPRYNVVARFQGGPNAGHTLEFEGRKHVLHQIPSGVFRDKVDNVIGNGVVLDPVILRKEIEKLIDAGVECKDCLSISKKAQLILPTHRLLDAAYEKSKGESKIGSTLKGIGPTYQDKVARMGLRIGDILSKEFKQKYDRLVKHHESILNAYKFDYDLKELEDDFFSAIEFLKNYRFIESEYVINNYLKEEKSVLAEGAQGSLLDIDFGSYPFVTSSNTMTAGACTGLGVAPSQIGEVFGIFKAYCTRVGSGPFPTELHDETGEKLRELGSEFGATTGRPRRCGWLDLPALKYAVMLNGVTQLYMMKADVLNDFKELKVCTEYKHEDGSVNRELPYDLSTNEVEPVYKSFKGWDCDLDGINEFSSLPLEMKEYIEYIEKYVGVPVTLVSIGPDREATIIKEEVPA
ncbi:adenylosuccinate synthase [Mangrovivirga sp. M17]|uniref:Adenylosuccinate synthetase n=1 Tax=Mangrovivirga halotolerans TaxID=2993936 RepID=A0ABT3RUL1_9BACT|nr:adenylosuccinate synthase [Mangrovivirga halotolerans]MCX2744937.1 adenylosuccinate synthase [Mangrovivirga halotolerans]